MRATARQYAEGLRLALHEKEDADRTVILRNFFEVLSRDRRKRMLPEILRQIERLELRERDLTKVHISLAHKGEEVSLKEEVASALGISLDRIIVEQSIEGNLLGGACFSSEGVTLDASSKRQLERLKQHLHL